MYPQIDNTGRALCAAACLVVACLPALPAEAGLLARPTVRIAFEFGLPEIERKFTEDELHRECGEIAIELAYVLENRVPPAWRFVPDEIPAGGPLLSVSIDKGTALSSKWCLDISMTSAGGDDLGSWEATLFEPGEVALKGLPGPAEWKGRIIEAFDAHMKRKHADLEALTEELQDAAPLAVTLQFESTPTHAVLPLALPEYDGLRDSIFRISCRHPTAGKFHILSRGVGLGRYNFGVVRPFDALLVENQQMGQKTGRREYDFEDFGSNHIALVPDLLDFTIHLHYFDTDSN